MMIGRLSTFGKPPPVPDPGWNCSRINSLRVDDIELLGKNRAFAAKKAYIWAIYPQLTPD